MNSDHSIYLPFECTFGAGGPASFMGNLRFYLEKQGYSYLQSAEQAKVIFFPAFFPFEILNAIKNKGGSIIQRLDGVYYPERNGEKYTELNAPIQEVYEHYADFVIFQSQYSRLQCFTMFGPRDNYAIIINGVHKHIFYPARPDKKYDITHQKVRFVTTGDFRHVDMLEPIVEALDSLVHSFDFELTVIGPITHPALESYLQRDYTSYLERKEHDDIAAIYRNSHIFLHSNMNSSCPNSVIEAISCGLPVVGFASGAVPELCFFSKDLLADVSGDTFQHYEDVDPHKLAEKIEFVVQNYAHYREMALAHSHLYSFEECGAQYLKIFEEFLKKDHKRFFLRQWSASILDWIRTLQRKS